ncbi:hypothetical protein QEN19_000908 [Hanseniaspora menglaensis]
MALLNLRSLNKLDLNLDLLIPPKFNNPENRLFINKIVAGILNVAVSSSLIAIFLTYMLSNNTSTYIGLIVIISALSVYNIFLFGVLVYSNHNKVYLKQPKVTDNQLNDIYHYEFCESCESFKLNRTHHSKKLNCCIYKFDHFCKWLGVAINYGNYKLFLQFIVLNILNCLIIFVLSLYRLIMQRKWLGLSIMYLAISAIFILTLSSLLSVHIRLIYSNETTIEFLNYRWLHKHDKQNEIIYNPILKIDGKLTYIGIKDAKKVYQRNDVWGNIKDALGPLNITLFLPTLNNFQTLNLEISDKLKQQYNFI